ncbi:MAG: aminomethyltransferase family protein [Anaerolineae bacterium]|nr:MAG: aminomethyltransferase family protein [Anaerolineae bacterium]
MPIPTPFHPRTSELSKSKEWREWSGYWSAVTYEHTHEREYFAIRNSAALIDISPLFKYDITGPQAAAVVDRIVPRDVSRCKVGQILYSPWCDDDGKVVDDGTLWRLGEHRFRITAADPSLRWFQDCGAGLEADVVDVSNALAALALQGPNARQILLRAAGAEDLNTLPYYYATQGEIGGAPVTITRTGYTGDLGYELWMDAADALEVWDRVVLAGADYGLLPAGLAALDVARIEAGLLLIDVDYVSSLKALTESRKSSPFELGLGWTVALEAGDFVGRRALLDEAERGSEWSLVGLEVVWSDLDRLYAAYDLAPQVAGRASRDPAPVYVGERQVGQATSTAFSPLSKTYLGLATIKREYAGLGQAVELEMTVEYQRARVPAQVSRKPFYDPTHKRS